MLTAAAPQAHALLPELADEIRLTRRVVERAPKAFFGWQPHPKSMTLPGGASQPLDDITRAPQTEGLDQATRHADFVPATAAAAQPPNYSVSAAWWTTSPASFSQLPSTGC